MGKGDNRKGPKMRQRTRQRKLKERQQRKIAAASED